MTARWNNLPTRCRCSHAAISHTGATGQCWVHPCACQQFRDKAEWDAAEARHPAKGIPAALDDRYDPSPDPIDRSIA